MYLPNVNKMTFMMDRPTYYYQVMLFGQKNAWVTYQRPMDKVFADHIGRNLKVYVDDMVVKSPNHEEHIKDLEEIFTQRNRGQPQQVRRHHLNEESLECKGSTKVDGETSSLSHFLPREVEKARPFFQLIKKSTSFH
ncbi:Retrovirus-related Pol polyprotein from transposon opus, partial [Mucuna pruriens]